MKSPALIQQTVEVIENVRLARDTFRIRLHAPELAGAIRPGQFVMLRLPGTTDPLLGRPLALYDTVLDKLMQPAAIDIVYLVVGKLTGRLAAMRPGERLEAWGPLGNTLPYLPDMGHVGLVAGGIGQTPFLAYIRQLLGQRGFAGEPAQRRARQVSLYYGVRTAELLAGVEDFRQAGATVHLASDDGTIGFSGYVTKLLESQLPPERLVGCGPEPMLRALAALADRWQVPCHLSLETPMACGIGICFSCVTRIRTPAGWDYRRVCVDGPVFDAASLAWDD
jgi:dihydroorotate dehydrogenase electron transfer subunit